jgi:RNA polymerase sigma-70 factor (ECF subfamily)
MAQDKPVKDWLSPAEFTGKLRELGPLELARLRGMARSFARFSWVDPEDLAHEAIHRTMTGNRHCPRDTAILSFLYGVMHSLVSDEAKARARHPEVQLEPLAESGMEWPSDAVGAEQEQIDRQEEQALIARGKAVRAQVMALFDDDLAAQIIAEGVMDDLEGEELRSLTELDKTAFASKRRLVRRRIGKAFPESAKND